MTNLYKIATKENYFFNSKIGLLTVNDLWELPLQSTVGKPNLNDVAKEIHASIVSEGQETFIPTANASSTKLTHLNNKLDLVKDIIATKVDENQKRSESAERAQKRQKLLAALERAENSELAELTPDEIKAQLAELA